MRSGPAILGGDVQPARDVFLRKNAEAPFDLPLLQEPEPFEPPMGANSPPRGRAVGAGDSGRGRADRAARLPQRMDARTYDSNEP